MEQSALAQVKLISTVKTCVSKSGVVMTCPLLGEQSPASPMPRGVLIPLCKRCGVSITAKDRRLKSGWAPLLDFFFLSFFIIFLASSLCLGCFSSTGWYWSAAVRQPLGESGIDRSGWSTKRSLRSSWVQASRIYWWRLTLSSKICSYWRWDKAAQDPQGLRGREA